MTERVAPAEATGSLKDGYETVAKLWSTFLDQPVNMEDVPNLMALLSSARSQGRMPV